MRLQDLQEARHHRFPKYVGLVADIINNQKITTDQYHDFPAEDFDEVIDQLTSYYGEPQDESTKLYPHFVWPYNNEEPFNGHCIEVYTHNEGPQGSSGPLTKETAGVIAIFS